MTTDTSLLVCIPFHFVPGRLIWLRQTLATFASYPHPVRVIVHTNTLGPAELAELHEAARHHAAMPIEVRSVTGLPHPFELTWAHKPVISGEFLNGAYSHFIYAEDDILIRPEAFQYWMEFRAPLARHGLVPGFLRVERDHGTGTLYATDQLRRTRLDWARMVRLRPWTFTSLDSAYTGSLVLDRDLAAEYVASPAFDLVRSRTVKNWDVRERAAMGLVFENVPKLFWSRLAIPVDPASLRVPDVAHVLHAPENYANDPAALLATIPADDILRPASLAHFMRARMATLRRLTMGQGRDRAT